MEDILKRLLEAEMRAEKLVREAESEQERAIHAAMNDARAEEERFRARVPELHRSYIHKAAERAEQTIAELRRRYDERLTQLRDMAGQRADEALEAAFALLLDPRH